MPEQTRKPSHLSAKSLVASFFVLFSAAFLVLTTREGDPRPYQRVIDSVFHNWIVMAVLGFLLWAVRRGWFGIVPKFFRMLSGFLLVFFVVFAAIGIVAWPPLWQFLRLFHVSQREIQPIAAVVVIAIWSLGCLALFVRGFVRWIGKRYQHHGIAVGFGPLYFYFRRRRTF